MLLKLLGPVLAGDAVLWVKKGEWCGVVLHEVRGDRAAIDDHKRSDKHNDGGDNGFHSASAYPTGEPMERRQRDLSGSASGSDGVGGQQETGPTGRKPAPRAVPG
jgi:hypothetical protein